MIPTIESFQNPLIKKIVQLQAKAKARKTSKQFVIEGVQEFKMAVKAGYLMDHILYCPEIIALETLQQIAPDFELLNTYLTAISLKVFEKIAYRQSTGGVVAVAQTKDLLLEEITFNKDTIPLILVAEAPEKPGNIGALLRTAHAAGLDAVFIANPNTDMFNPNIVRSSTGSLFKVPIATGSTEEILKYLKMHNFQICTTALQNAQPYYHQDFTQKTAIVVGTEHEGLSAAWLENSDQNLIIPMQYDIDSLNVSVAAGIFIFEALRQRALAGNPLPL